MKTKICPQCKLKKDISEFYKNKKTKNGRSCYCKICSNKNLLKYKNRKPIYSKNHYKKYRKKILASNIETTKKQRKTAFKIVANGKNIECYKNKEWHCCGDKTNQDYLSFDHIKGNGFAHRKEIGEGPKSLYLWIIKNPNLAKKQLQIICMNAQILKTRLNKEDRTQIKNKPKWNEDNIGTPIK
jgi:hypothetical protein